METLSQTTLAVALNDRKQERASTSKVLHLYEQSLDAAIAWLHRSIRNGKGGSSTYFGIWGRWADPYPETTGYIIPTLLEHSRRTGDDASRAAAIDLGTWLLGIQQVNGYWYGGSHPPRRKDPSVFNTAQILLGLVALYEETGDPQWLSSAERGAAWLAAGVDDDGEWKFGNYKDGHNPSYYTRVAWPMLEVWAHNRSSDVLAAAERVLKRILGLKKENGVFPGWGFEPDQPAFTHTIAYTLRGFIESARLLDNWPVYGRPVEDALERLFRKAELSGGKLPGALHDDWSAAGSYICLTGNAQMAICLMKYYDREGDLRLLNASCKLLDQVCASQSHTHPLEGIRGAIAGSKPIWGRYLAFRYPNWAAKFHCDALMMLMERLKSVGL